MSRMVHAINTTDPTPTPTPMPILASWLRSEPESPPAAVVLGRFVLVVAVPDVGVDVGVVVDVDDDDEEGGEEEEEEEGEDGEGGILITKALLDNTPLTKLLPARFGLPGSKMPKTKFELTAMALLSMLSCWPTVQVKTPAFRASAVAPSCQYALGQGSQWNGQARRRQPGRLTQQYTYDIAVPVRDGERDVVQRAVPRNLNSPPDRVGEREVSHRV